MRGAELFVQVSSKKPQMRKLWQTEALYLQVPKNFPIPMEQKGKSQAGSLSFWQCSPLAISWFILQGQLSSRAFCPGGNAH